MSKEYGKAKSLFEKKADKENESKLKEVLKIERRRLMLDINTWMI